MANNINWNSFKGTPNGFTTGVQHNGLVDACRTLPICESPDYRVTRTPSGTKLLINFPYVNIPAPPPTPYQVTVSGSDAGGWSAKVGNGYILWSDQPTSSLAIATGSGGSALNQYFTFVPGDDLIWIYVTIDTDVATTATIQSYGQGDGGFDPTLEAWDDTGGFVQDDGGTPPKQIALNIPIFSSLYDDDSNIVNTQLCSNHILLIQGNESFRPAIVARPSLYIPYGVT